MPITVFALTFIQSLYDIELDRLAAYGYVTRITPEIVQTGRFRDRPDNL